MTDLKSQLEVQLKHQREAILLKVEGLSERELRLPRTPTGLSLLGIVKHALNVEHGYFGLTFGAVLPPTPSLMSPRDYSTDPQVDWYATENESAASLIGLYHRVIAFSDTQIHSMSLDARGVVPWWHAHGKVTLGEIMVHVICDLARHAGQADILRESIDGAVGFWGPGNNIPQGYDWPGYVGKLTALAESYR